MNTVMCRFIGGLLSLMPITNICSADWFGVGPRWYYNGQETMYVGPLSSGGQGFSFAYAWGPFGAQAGGSIEMWPDTYFKSGRVNLQNPYNGSSTLMALTRNTADSAFAEFYDVLDEPMVTISTVGNYSGGIWVSDNTGQPVYSAGINGSNGDVWGRTKSFIVPHPKDENLMIRYTALEGPEAAIYTRGTVNLVSGQAYVTLPEHFSVMANAPSITVSLTPRAAESKGVAAVEVTGQGFRVVELFQGTGDYSVDYLVHALRSGFENHQVYLPRTRPEQASSSSPNGTDSSETFEDYLPSPVGQPK